MISLACRSVSSHRPVLGFIINHNQSALAVSSSFARPSGTVMESAARLRLVERLLIIVIVGGGGGGGCPAELIGESVDASRR
jgi:hypothetical protein